jgi:tetratricopeptide (TPR) repeat protein
VFRVAAVYAAAAWVVIEASATILPALHLPEWTVTAVVIAALFGFPVALVLAWAFEFTPEGLRRTEAVVPGVEPAVHEVSRARGIVAVLLVAVLAATGGYLAGRRISGPRATVDDRLGLAVFPFRPAGAAVEEWSEGVADLLATVLDGTPGVRIADPWSLWRRLRRERSARAESPDPVEASQLAREAGARHFVLGSIVGTGERFDVSVRVYAVDEAEPLYTFMQQGAPDGLSAVVQGLAVDLITRLWTRDELPSVPELDRYATRSADALKAYLDAKEAMRRGLVDSADVAIDRALALDSTFALGWIAAASIKSWVQYLRGEYFHGLLEIAERAVERSDSLSERNRLRAQAMLASIRTDGITAADAARQIIEIDETDLEAWDRLSYCHQVYGWQYGAEVADAVAAAEHLIQMDLTYVPGLARRALLAAALGDLEDVRLQLTRLEKTDTTTVLVRGTLLGLRAVLASDDQFDALADSIARAPMREWFAPMRFLRIVRPDRVETLMERVADQAGPGRPQWAVAGVQGRIALAEGRLTELDSGLQAGEYRAANLDPDLHRALVVSSLAGLGRPESARRSVEWLARYIPIDSAPAYWGERLVWPTAWALGAYQASFGDTAVTRSWQEVIGTFPPGGTPKDYRGSLRSDLEARLAARRGDLLAALQQARQAFDLWAIHTDNDWEGSPEPSMRLHLALLYRAAGQSDSARALLRSLVPPSTWMGFLTVRSSFELGELAENRGDFQAAARHYGNALRYWERGGPEVSEWRERAEGGLLRVVAERG